MRRFFSGQWLSSLSLGKKFTLLLLPPIVMIALMGGVSFYCIGRVQAAQVEAIALSSKAEVLSRFENDGNILRTVHVSMIAAAHNPTYLKARGERLTDYEKRVEESSANLEQISWSPEDKGLVEVAIANMKQYQTGFAEVLGQAKAGKLDADTNLMEANVANARKSREAVDAARKLQLSTMARLNSANAAIVGRIQLGIGVAAVLAVGLGLLLSRLILKGIHDAINKVGLATKALAVGDLTQRVNVESEDELGQIANGLDMAIRKFAESIQIIRQISDQVASGTMELSATADQLSATTIDISKGADEQRETMSHSAAALGQVSTSIRDVNERLNHAQVLAEASQRVTNDGLESAKETTLTMTAIRESSNAVAGITLVIREIANQTNLLSLNAAIEAAKAGQAGKGFAVVADEIRKLAQRSAEAANEIQALIQASGTSVNAGSQTVEKVSRSLQAIEANTLERSKGTAAIHQSVGEQAKAIEDVNQAVNTTTDLADRNASATTELAATILETKRTIDILAATAIQLQGLTQAFSV